MGTKLILKVIMICDSKRGGGYQGFEVGTWVAAREQARTCTFPAEHPFSNGTVFQHNLAFS